MTLQTEFTELIFRLTGDAQKALQLWSDIEKHYNEASRHYHNLTHLNHLIQSLKQVKHEIDDWDILVLAIAYHDIIYNTHKSNNEEKSAEYADRALASVLPDEKKTLLTQFIMATKAHEEHESKGINYFTDADLSILGASPEEYDLYTKQIRKEYRLYPALIYKPGRAKVIRHFLAMDIIFKTPFFYEHFEEAARRNLSAELKAI